jgi:hypothetical protein
MIKPSDKILQFMEFYKVDSDEIWLLPGGKSYAVNHSALERVAAEQKIEFEAPFHIRDEGELGASLAGYGSLQDIRLWATGGVTAKNAEIRTLSPWRRSV